MTDSFYIPADRPEYLNDPISLYADQLLTEWAWNNGHRIRNGKCHCGELLATDEAIRKHWQSKRDTP